MPIRGWVYVMTNRSMPGLVKIGYSTKDPAARAGELVTGSPSKYEIAFDVLVEDPQPIEQRVHKILARKREGNEWFRCGISEAISEIRTVVGKRAIAEKIAEKLSEEADDRFFVREAARAQLKAALSSPSRDYAGRGYSMAKLKEEMKQIRNREEEL